MSSQTHLPNEETRFAEMVFPDQANHYGALFAGAGLALLSGKTISAKRVSSLGRCVCDDMRSRGGG